MAVQDVPVTDELLAGLYGNEPTLTLHFDLWLDSGGRAAISPPVSVDLVTGANLATLVYDNRVLLAAASTEPGFEGRRVTFTQKDPTTLPAWTTVIATLKGDPESPWTLTDAKAGIFEVVSAGVQEINASLGSTLTPGFDTQSSGGMFVEKAGARYKFPRNGAIVVKVNTGTSSTHETQWSTLRLTLHDPHDALTVSRLRARRFATMPTSAAGFLEQAVTVLGPVNAGYRFVDFAFAAPVSTQQYVLIEAPILKYLLAFKSAWHTLFAADTTSEDFEIYYAPSLDYASGFRNTTMSTFTSRGLASDLQVWRGMNSSGPGSTPTQEGPRFDYAWGVPDATDPLPLSFPGYSLFPHGLRDVDITIDTAPRLAALGRTERGHFSH